MPLPSCGESEPDAPNDTMEAGPPEFGSPDMSFGDPNDQGDSEQVEVEEGS